MKDNDDLFVISMSYLFSRRLESSNYLWHISNAMSWNATFRGTGIVTKDFDETIFYTESAYNAFQ